MNAANKAARGAKDAEQAADLLVTVATTLNQRLAITADELARSQAMLREASEELMTAFRGAADRIVAAQKVEVDNNQTEKSAEFGVVLDEIPTFMRDRIAASTSRDPASAYPSADLDMGPK